MKTNKMLAGLSLLTAALPSAVFAQVINRPSNDRPVESSGNNTYIIIAVIVVVALAAFFFFRSKGKS